MKAWIKDKIKDFVDDCKKLHKSMTMWMFGIVAFLSEAVPLIVEFMPQLQEYIPSTSYQTWMRVLLIGGFILRFKTTKAIRQK